MKRVEENLRRLQISTVVTHVAEMSGPIDFLPGKVMGVLLDAPCSGLGTLQRRPDLRWKLKPRDIEELTRKQLALLENIEPWLAPGGKLVYSTCTLTPEENRNLVRSFLRRNPAYRIASPLPYLPETVHSMVDEDGYLETLPHRDRMDGMFAVRLEKGE
jgi:16S rRNA (cytosine967-C5)-methyltransferase